MALLAVAKELDIRQQVCSKFEDQFCRFSFPTRDQLQRVQLQISTALCDNIHPKRTCSSIWKILGLDCNTSSEPPRICFFPIDQI